MIFNVEPMIFPPGNIGGNLYERYLSPACCLSWMSAPLQEMNFWRWVVVLLGKGSGKDPNGVQFRGRLHRNG
jgi:hypothetical protein